jgi:hypothetical protein
MTRCTAGALVGYDLDYNSTIRPPDYEAFPKFATPLDKPEGMRYETGRMMAKC